MISAFRHLSRSTALQSSRRHCCLRPPPAVSSSSSTAAPFSSVANTGFASTVSNAENNGHLSKGDLAQIIRAEHDLKLSQSNRILDTLFDSIVEVRSTYVIYEPGVYNLLFHFLLTASKFSHVSCPISTTQYHYYYVTLTGRLQKGHRINLRLWEIHPKNSHCS